MKMPRWPEKLTEEERLRRSRERCRKYYHAHKDTLTAYHREMRKANPKKYLERDRIYYRKKAAVNGYQKQRYARSDKTAARAALREWRAKNPEKEHETWKRTYEKHKDKHRARTKRWIKNNPEARAAIVDRRRAKEFGVAQFGNYTKNDIKELLTKYGRFCFYCGSALKKFHADHFIPLSRGGKNSADNIVLSCPSCNFSKGGKMPWEWLPEKFNEVRSW